MSRKRSIKRPVAIAVEGANFFHFLLNKIDGMAEFENVQLWDFMENGLTVHEWLKSFRMASGFDSLKALGIIRDAELDTLRMQQSLEDALQQSGFSVPKSSKDVAIGVPNVSYLIVPDGAPSGCLEHAILESVNAKLPLACAEDFLGCIEEHNQERDIKVREEAYAVANWQVK